MKLVLSFILTSVLLWKVDHVASSNLRQATTEGKEGPSQGLDADLVHTFLADVVNPIGCVPVPPELETCSSNGPKPFCIPNRSPDMCPSDISLPALIQKRTRHIRNNDVAASGWWFQALEDKMASYVYAAERGFNPPKMLHCSSEVPGGLEDFDANLASGGFVIRATHLHSGSGVYVFPDGFDGNELITGMPMSLDEVELNLVSVGATRFVIEEFVHGESPGTLPMEYKFHMFNGEVGSINVLSGSGSDCGCWAEIDTNGNRLDSYGCFTPSPENSFTDEVCLDEAYVKAGTKKAYPVKGVGLCSVIPPVDQCSLNNMIELAKTISADIGAYLRVDMFLGGDGKIYLQELSTNHFNGLRQCSAKKDENGCIDPCFLGKMWKKEYGNEIMGGVKKAEPSFLSSFLSSGDADKCYAALKTEVVTSVLTNDCADSHSPSEFPLESPSASPSGSTIPSASPSDTVSSFEPSVSKTPSGMPTDLPSNQPSESTLPPTSSALPTTSPSNPDIPVSPPAAESTSFPSASPTEGPSDTVSPLAQLAPSGMPTDLPSNQPSESTFPTYSPTQGSSSTPSHLPSPAPSTRPSGPSSQPSTLPSFKPSSSDPCRSAENVLIFLGAEEIISFDKDTVNVTWDEPAVYNLQDDQFYFCGNETYDVFVAEGSFNFTADNYTHQDLIELSAGGTLRHYETEDDEIIMTDFPGGSTISILVTAKVINMDEDFEYFSFNRVGSVLNVSSSSPEIRDDFRGITNVPDVSDTFSVNVTGDSICFKTMNDGSMPAEVAGLEPEGMIYAFDDADDVVMARLLVKSLDSNTSYIEWSIQRVGMDGIFDELSFSAVASSAEEDDVVSDGQIEVQNGRRRLFIGSVVKFVKKGIRAVAKAIKAVANAVSNIQAEFTKEIDLVNLDIVRGAQCTYEREFENEAETGKITIASEVQAGLRFFANAKVTLEAKISLVKGLKEAKVNVASEAGASLIAKFGASANLEYELKKRVFAPRKQRKIFVVKVVPILLAYQPTVDLLFRSALNLEIEASLQATASVSMELEYSYDQNRPAGSRFETESKFERKFEFERPEISGRAEFELEMGPVFSFNVWFYEILQGSLSLDTLVTAGVEVGSNLEAIVIAPPYYTLDKLEAGLRFRLSAQAGINTELAKAIDNIAGGDDDDEDDDNGCKFVTSIIAKNSTVGKLIQSRNVSAPLENIKSFVGAKALSQFGQGLSQPDQLSGVEALLAGATTPAEKNDPQLSMGIASILQGTDTFNKTAQATKLKDLASEIGSIEVTLFTIDVPLLSISEIDMQKAEDEDPMYCQGDDAIVITIEADVTERGLFFRGIAGQQWYTDLDGSLLYEDSPWRARSTTDEKLVLHLPRTATNESYALPLDGNVYLRTTPKLLPFLTNSQFAKKDIAGMFEDFEDVKFDCCDDSDCDRKLGDTLAVNQISSCQNRECQVEYKSAAPSVTPGTPTGAPSTSAPSTSLRPSLRPSLQPSSSPSKALTCPQTNVYLEDKTVCEGAGLSCTFEYEETNAITGQKCNVRDECECQTFFSCTKTQVSCQAAPTPSPTVNCPPANNNGRDTLLGQSCTGTSSCDFQLSQTQDQTTGAICNPTAQCDCNGSEFACSEQSNCQAPPTVCSVRITEVCVDDVSDGGGGIEMKSIKINENESLSGRWDTDGGCRDIDVNLSNVRTITVNTEEVDTFSSNDFRKFEWDVNGPYCKPGSYTSPERSTGDGKWSFKYIIS